MTLSISAIPLLHRASSIHLMKYTPSSVPSNRIKHPIQAVSKKSTRTFILHFSGFDIRAVQKFEVMQETQMTPKPQVSRNNHILKVSTEILFL